MDQPRTASLTQTVKHEPCRFLLNANLFGDLHGADALTGGDEQVHGIEPLMQRDVDRSKMVPVRMVKSSWHLLQR